MANIYISLVKFIFIYYFSEIDMVFSSLDYKYSHTYLINYHIFVFLFVLINLSLSLLHCTSKGSRK